MLSVLLAPLNFCPSRDVVTRLPTRRTRSCVPVANAPAQLSSGSVDYTSEQQRAREWYNTWIKTRSLQNTIRHASVVAMAPVAEMPAVLAEWGCDDHMPTPPGCAGIPPAPDSTSLVTRADAFGPSGAEGSQLRAADEANQACTLVCSV